MAYINDLFQLLITEMPYPWVKDWANSYAKFSNSIQSFKQNLIANPSLSIDDSSLYVGITSFNDYKTLVYKLLYERNNYIASRGRSILSKENLNKAINDPALKPLLRKIILQPDAINHKEFETWWIGLTGGNNPVLINRAFAACSPKTLTTTVDNSKFWYVINFLKTECNFAFPANGSNWVAWNEMVTAWLDVQLIVELSSYSNQFEQNNWRNIFFWLLYEFEPSAFEFKKQLIKYGAPGTGKTYTCLKDVQSHFIIWKNIYYKSYPKTINNQLTTVQFHPSFTYEDFMEGIKPVLNNDGKTDLKLVNGTFKTFCKEASKWEMDVYKQIPAIINKEWSEITVRDVIGSLHGEIWEFLKEVKNPEKTLLDKVIPPFYFIIDEINRAELSRVLGELLYCLEYRGYKGRIRTQYNSLVDNETSDAAYLFENGTNYFFIPNNVYLLGTMNNIDRSVESFDFALRRRFQWEKVTPNYDLIINDDLPEDLEPIVQSLEKLNNKICTDPLLGEDYMIGHSYFMKRPAIIKNMDLIECKKYYWEHNIQPLLEEYLRGSGENSRMKEYKNIFLN